MQLNPHFRRPLKITLIAFAVALVVVIAGGTWIYFQGVSKREAENRAELMGSGVGMMTCLVVAPFWIFAADKVGKERRARKAQSDSDA